MADAMGYYLPPASQADEDDTAPNPRAGDGSGAGRVRYRAAAAALTTVRNVVNRVGLVRMTISDSRRPAA